ncbi:MAG: hypothetical protein CGW95_01160 [Phenylobacterium zucineum]|nr:MAG: hypothetical protein CGW95_01160 [Phenylobacterium zucineum]
MVKLNKRIYVLAGSLRERITIQDQNAAIDTDGSELTTWTDIATAPTVWARLEPDSVVEDIIGGRGQTRRKWVCTIRYRTDITTRMRVSWRGRVMNVIGIVNVGERRKYLTLELVETNLIQ